MYLGAANFKIHSMIFKNPSDLSRSLFLLINLVIIENIKTQISYYLKVHSMIQLVTFFFIFMISINLIAGGGISRPVIEDQNQESMNYQLNLQLARAREEARKTQELNDMLRELEEQYSSRELHPYILAGRMNVDQAFESLERLRHARGITPEVTIHEEDPKIS